MSDSLDIQVVRLEERLAASHEALKVAKIETDRRLESMNELRDQISSERGNYLNRSEYDLKHDALKSRIDSLEKFQYMIVGGLLVFQVLIGILLHYWHS
jgi:hypothetical protein